MVGDTNTGGDTSSPTTLGDSFNTSIDVKFNQEQCLFCNQFLADFEANVSHMHTAHGLFISSKERLLVDLETLFAYLHLVIFGYHECICCGTQRSTTQAVQQHMIGKSHCKVDISKDSEYADFYDFSESESESIDEEEEEADDAAAQSRASTVKGPTQDDQNSLRLPSGKIISNRTQPQTNPRRQPLRSRSPRDRHTLEQPSAGNDPQASSTSLIPQEGRRSLTRAEKQDKKFARHLATLRANDERSLAHLSLPEQRALITTQQKQVEKAGRVEKRYRSRLEGLGNQTLMTHFVKDAADKRTLWK